MTGEQVAVQYLKELVRRNLVVVSKDSSSARVSKCRVLELVHEINISRRYNFITVLESDYRSPCGDNRKIRRLSAQNGKFESLKKRNNMSDMTGLRTFLVFGQQETSLSDLKMVLAESKFLKVLDLQGVPNLEQFPDQVFDLILLKYLNMRGTKVNRIPKRIKKLVRLETLDLKRTQVTDLPDDVYKLQNLLTLLISSSSGKQQGAKGIAVSKGVSYLSSIQKLSLITVETEESIQALEKLKALRKLGVVTKDGSELATVFQKMETLSTLDVRSSGVHLNLAGYIFPRYLSRLHLSGTLLSGSLPKQVSRQSSLQKISLYRSNLTVQPLDHLQDLPYLIELDLRGYYNGFKLEFESGKFKKLETLIIQGFTNLNTIVFQNGATPMLKKLTVSKCYKLSTLNKPENFTAEISGDSAFLETAQIAVKEGADSRL